MTTVGQVEPRGGHEHAGDDLVAVRDQHDRVEGVGRDGELDGVGDDLAARRASSACRRGSSRCRRRRRWSRSRAACRRPCRMPAFTASAILSSIRCPGMISFAELMTATSGREISSSVRPSALSRLRCGALDRPPLHAVAVQLHRPPFRCGTEAPRTRAARDAGAPPRDRAAGDEVKRGHETKEPR